MAVKKTFAGYARKISGLSGRIHQFSLWMKHFSGQMNRLSKTYEKNSMRKKRFSGMSGMMKQTAHTMRNLSGLSRKVSRQIGAIAGKIRKYSRKISVLKSLGKNRGKIGRLAKSVADVVEKRR